MPSWEVTTADLPAVDPVNIICTIINSRHSNADSKQTAFTILTDFVSTSVAVAGGDVGALAGLALKAVGDGINKLFGDANPECAGVVFEGFFASDIGSMLSDQFWADGGVVTRLGDITHKTKTFPILSKLPQVPPRGCGAADADVFVTVIRDELPSFPPDPPPRQFRLAPVSGQNVNTWAGIWSELPIEDSCRVVCQITANPPADSGQFHFAASLNVTATEHFGAPPTAAAQTQIHSLEFIVPEPTAATEFLFNKIPDPSGITTRTTPPFSLPTIPVAVEGTADTAKIDDNVTLQLYGQFPPLPNNSIVEFAIRYTRRDQNGNIVTDAMLGFTQCRPT